MKLFGKGKEVGVNDAGDEMNVNDGNAAPAEGETGKADTKPGKSRKKTLIKVAKGAALGVGAGLAAVAGFKFRGLWDSVGESMAKAAAETVPEIAEQVVADPDVVADVVEAVAEVVEEGM